MYFLQSVDLYVECNVIRFCKADRKAEVHDALHSTSLSTIAMALSITSYTGTPFSSARNERQSQLYRLTIVLCLS